MQNILRDMVPFVEVATQKSFTRAADVLGIPTSTMSRRIARLEEELEVQLFNRSPRKVELTEAGEMYFKRCEFIVSEAVDAQEALKKNTSTPSGRLRISTPIDFGQYCGDVIIDFVKKYPDISLDIRHTEIWADLIADPFDLEIRVGEMPDSNLIARKLAQFEAGLFASPEFLKKHPHPKTPNDLHSLPCLCLRQESSWNLQKDGEELSFVHRQPRCSVNSISFLIELTTAGLGIGMLNLALGKPLVEKGKLVRVLEDWAFPQKPVWIVVASRQMPARVSLFIDFLLKRLGNASQ